MLNYLEKTEISGITDVLNLDDIENIDLKKRVVLFEDKKRSLIISSSFIPKDHFCDNFFTIRCILRNKIMITTLANTYITRYSFINKKYAETFCQVLKIKLQYLINPKQI